jgi:hypothetical protein
MHTHIINAKEESQYGVVVDVEVSISPDGFTRTLSPPALILLESIYRQPLII